MDQKDLFELAKGITIPLPQAMEEQIFLKEAYVTAIDELTDAETATKIKKRVEQQAIARVEKKFQELQNELMKELSKDTPPSGVTDLNDWRDR